jgi:hypothetical protein
VRELLPIVPQDVGDQKASELWDDILGAWAGAASWYGLHAHMHLGAVAAATGLWHLRQQNSGRFGHDKELPVGAVASANYSLIQRIPSGPIRYLAFLSLRRFMDRHLRLAPSIGDNLFIRGSIELRLGNPFAALADFREGLRILESRQVPLHKIGDAMVHVAVPLALIGRRKQARVLIDEGLGHMRGRVPAGPLLRALRKAIQVEAYAVGGRERIKRFRQEVRQLEKNDGYLDQTRHFQ